jgi:hypothetical protein
VTTRATEPKNKDEIGDLDPRRGRRLSKAGETRRHASHVRVVLNRDHPGLVGNSEGYRWYAWEWRVRTQSAEIPPARGWRIRISSRSGRR